MVEQRDRLFKGISAVNKTELIKNHVVSHFGKVKARND